MSSVAGGPPHRRGQYTSRACNECRRRRSKCDGARPTCGSCSFYGHQCSWGNESDAHRPPTKQLVETLRVKVQVLENELARLRAARHEQDDQATGAMTPASILTHSSASVVRETRFPSESRLTAPDAAPARREHAQQSPWLAYLKERTDALVGQPPGIAYQFIFNIDTTAPPNEQPEGSYHSMVCDWNRHLPVLDGIQFTRLEHDTLLDKCFKYSSSWLMSIVPQFFLYDMLRALAYAHETPEIDYYSPLLHCSLLAFAAALSDDPLIKQPGTRKRFADTAKRLLHDELRQPNVCFIQALMFLSEYHCGIGEASRGYMYLGMAIHAVRALDFGKSELRPPAMSGWCFWSVYSQDKIMSLELNMESNLRSMSRPTLEFPAVDWEIDRWLWPGLGSSSGQATGSRLTQVFAETCRLMLIMESVIRLRHPSGPAAVFVGDNRATEIHWKLDAWLSELPTDLLISENTSTALPQIIALNIAYWWIILLLHQPYYRPIPDRNAPPVSALRPFGDLSDMLCDRAAQRIMLLLDLYVQLYGLSLLPRGLIPAIQAVGILHLKRLTSTPDKSNAQGVIRDCIAALRTIANTWQSAEKYVDHLQGLLDEYYSELSTQRQLTPIDTSWLPNAGYHPQSAAHEREATPAERGSSYSYSIHEGTSQ